MTRSSARIAVDLPALDDEPGLFSIPQKPVVATRKVEKAATAFRTISEVGDELGVPQHVLRFWETKFTQLRPLKRGGGRRYYRADDVAILRQIHGLLYGQGYTIKGAQRVLKDRNPEAAAASPPKEAVIDEPVETSTPDEVRAILSEMLAELKALRALV